MAKRPIEVRIKEYLETLGAKKFACKKSFSTVHMVFPSTAYNGIVPGPYQGKNEDCLRL